MQQANYDYWAPCICCLTALAFQAFAFMYPCIKRDSRRSIAFLAPLELLTICRLPRTECLSRELPFHTGFGGEAKRQGDRLLMARQLERQLAPTGISHALSNKFIQRSLNGLQS